MAEARRQDWAVLGLRPGTSAAEIDRAYLQRRSIYERDSLATYTLLTDRERRQMLDRIELAYRRITGREPDHLESPGSASGANLAQAVEVLAERADEGSEGVQEVAPEPGAEAADESLAAEDVTEQPQRPSPDPQRLPGLYLRHHRQVRNLEIADVAAETKIRGALLEKLEREDYDALPAGVYVRGFVIQYARFVGIGEPEKLAAAYVARMEAKRSE